MIWIFEAEIAETAHKIQETVEAGENDLFQHAWLMADAVERMLERYFPKLATAEALDPQETVAALLKLYAAIHEDTANEPALQAEGPAPRAALP
jgi:predicted N-acyltransferase